MPASAPAIPENTSSGSPSPAATAGWKGPEPTKVRNCLSDSAAETASAGPVSQPTFQPVTENVFPPEPIVSVRSAIPGRVATGTCAAPSKVRCS